MAKEDKTASLVPSLLPESTGETAECGDPALSKGTNRPAGEQPSVHHRRKPTTRFGQPRVGRLRNREVFQKPLTYRLHLVAVATEKVQKAAEGILNLTTNHVHVSHGQLGIQVVRGISRHLPDLADVSRGGTVHEESLGLFTPREVIIGISLNQLGVGFGGTRIITLLGQSVGLLVG